MPELRTSSPSLRGSFKRGKIRNATDSADQPEHCRSRPRREGSRKRSHAKRRSTPLPSTAFTSYGNLSCTTKRYQTKDDRPSMTAAANLSDPEPPRDEALREPRTRMFRFVDDLNDPFVARRRYALPNQSRQFLVRDLYHQRPQTFLLHGSRLVPASMELRPASAPPHAARFLAVLINESLESRGSRIASGSAFICAVSRITGLMQPILKPASV